MLTIIVPVYNAERTLCRAVNSVLAQTFTDWELLLIDDGSEDSSGNICDQLAEQYPNIICFHQKNRGLSAARNVGIRNAKGHYLAFLDSDDWVEPDFYQSLIDEQLSTIADLVVSGYVREFWKANVCLRKIDIELEEICLVLKEISEYHFQSNKSYNLFIHVWNKLYLHETIKENHILFDETVRFAEDVPFNLQYYQHIERIFISKQMGYHYICLNNGNLTAKWTPDLLGATKHTYRLIRDFFIKNNILSGILLNNSMYLRGCFLTLEKAVNAQIPYCQVQSFVHDICHSSETYEVLASQSITKRFDVEALIYSMLFRIRCPRMIYVAVILRKRIKQLLKRI